MTSGIRPAGDHHGAPRNKARRADLWRTCVLLACIIGGTTMAVRPSARAEPISPSSLDTILQWQSLGPDRGGRVTTVAGVPQRRFRFYAGTVGGGILRSNNAGATWDRIDTKVFGSASVGAIAVAPSAPDTIYVGMGESTQRMYMSTIGDGVYKSTDGGDTWAKLGLDETRRVGTIVVHPTNPDVVYVAAMGQSWARSEHRGVYRSRDGGRTWEQVLFVSDTTSAASVSMDAHDPNTVYAAMWDNLRTPWYLGSGGPGSGLYKTTDGGNHWRKLTKGLPPQFGKGAVSVSPVDSQRVYANLEATLEEGGLYVSRDGGETWTRTNGTIDLWSRAWYYMHVYADPVTADRVWINCTELWRSDDAGKTFVRIRNEHGDNHAIWVNPTSPDIMVQGNDGGVSVSLDGGGTWSTLYNQRTGQFWRVAVDTRVPYTVFGAQQDWGTIAIRRRADLGGPAGGNVHEVGGGEGGYVIVDHFDQNIVYAGSELGFMTRFDRQTGIKTVINPYPRFPEGIEPKDLKYRYDVDAPIVASRHTPGVVYHAANVVFRSEDRGQTWKPISPDLTRNEVARQGKAGGPFTNEIIDAYSVIASLDESPLDANVLWAGSDDGKMEMTRDGGRTWRDATPPDVTDGEFYTITASPSNVRAAYAALARYRLGDMRPHLYKTVDYGATWTAVSDTLPQTTYARVLLEDPKRPSLLYAGTEAGLYVSYDSGHAWRELSATLPTVSVTGIVTAGLDDNDLVISTEGSGFWTVRGLATLRQIAAEMPTRTRLFAPAPAYIIEGMPAESIERGREPSERHGVAIDVFLTETNVQHTSDAKLLIADSDDVILANLWPTGDPASRQPRVHAGLNRFYWNGRRGATAVRVIGAFDGELRGVRVPAGHYQVRLAAGGETQTQSIDLQWSPSKPAPPAAAVAERHALLRKLEAIFRDVAETVNAEAAERKSLDASTQGNDPQRARALADWERQVFDRRLVYGQGRVDYGGGLLFDLKTLHQYIETAESPVGSAMSAMADELGARWNTIKLARPR
jgi:photosystem II stability/assembly factor-like uncharacterized protein